MDESQEARAKRLRWAVDRRYTSSVDAARALNIAEPTFHGHYNGWRGFKSRAARYADFFRIDLEWLLTGRGSPEPKGQIPVLGKMGAGAAVFPIDDHAMGAAIDHLDIVREFGPGSVGVQIVGNSMWPFQEGWVAAFTRTCEGVPDVALNSLCVVRIEGTGETLLKVVRQGSKAGFHNLESWNAPLRLDERLQWAAKVRGIIVR